MSVLKEALKRKGVKSSNEIFEDLCREAMKQWPKNFQEQVDYVWYHSRLPHATVFENHRNTLVGPKLRELAGRDQRAGGIQETHVPPATIKPGNGGRALYEGQNHAAAAQAPHAGGDDHSKNDAHDVTVVPARARSTAADLGALKESVQKCVFDTFRITERNGEKTAIGDIPPSRYPALLGHLGKRSWVATREYNLIYLLDQHKPATYPLGAMTRDIFDEKQMLKFVAMATDMATPKLPEEARG